MMYIQLHNILAQLDSNIIDVENYFDWSEDEKEALIFYIGKCFYPVIQRGENHKKLLMATIWNVIRECEENDEFEQADIMSRCLFNLEEGRW